MQILELVATKHMRCMLAEWRKVPLQLQLEAGEPILSLRLNTDTMRGEVYVGVTAASLGILSRGRKGSRLKFLRLDKDAVRGNANEVGDVCRSFGESCLFFLTVTLERGRFGGSRLTQRRPLNQIVWRRGWKAGKIAYILRGPERYERPLKNRRK